MASVLGILALLLAGTIGMMAMVRPVWAVVLLTLMWPLEQVIQVSNDFLAARGWVFNAYVGIVMALAALITFLRGQADMRSYFNGTWFCALLFYAWAGMSLMWTRYPTLGFETANWLLPYIVVALIGAPVCIRRLSDVTELRWGIMVCASLLALIVLLHPRFSFYGDRAFVQFSSTERGNPLALATLGATALVFGALSRDSGTGRLFAPLRIAAMVFGISLAVTTGSRGQMIAGAFVAMLFFPLVHSLRNLKGALVTLVSLPVFAAVLWVAFFSFLSSKNIGRWSVDSIVEGIAGRVSLATGALGAYFKSPEVFLMGFGTMSYSIVVPEGGVDFCENMFVEALTDLGVIGAGLLAVIVFMGVRSVMRLRVEARTTSESVNAMCLAGLMALEFLIAAKSYNIWTGFMPIALCVIAHRIAIVEREAREAEDMAWEESGRDGLDGEGLDADGLDADGPDAVDQDATDEDAGGLDHRGLGHGAGAPAAR